MLKKSLFNISYVSLGNIINAFLGFVFLSAAAKDLSVEDFGKYALLTSVLVASSRLMDFGTNSVFVAKSISGTAKLKNTFISTKIILFFIAFPIAATVLYFLDLFSLEWLLILLGGFVGYGMNYTFYALFQRAQKFIFTVFLNFIPALVKGGMGILALAGFVELNITLAFGIFSLSMLLTFIFYFFLPAEDKNFNLSSQSIKELLKSSYMAGTAQIIRESWSALSNSILKVFQTFTDVGIFSLANKIANIFTLISLSVFTVLLPKNAYRKKQNLEYNFKETFYIAILILIGAGAAIFVGKFFILTFFGEKFVESVFILDILIISYAFSSIYTFMENYFYIHEQQKVILSITTLHLATFLLLSAVLVPAISTVGIAYAHLISSFLALSSSVFGAYYFSKKSQV